MKLSIYISIYVYILSVNETLLFYLLCCICLCASSFGRDYLFVNASDDINVVVLIHPTSESADTPEADMPQEEVVDTMGDDMMDELK